MTDNKEWTAEGWDHLMEALADNEALLADGFEDALIGITAGIESRAVYDINAMVAILVHRDGMTTEDAEEYINFNVVGAYVGEKGPMYISMDDRRVRLVKPLPTPPPANNVNFEGWDAPYG